MRDSIDRSLEDLRNLNRRFCDLPCDGFFLGLATTITNSALSIAKTADPKKREAIEQGGSYFNDVMGWLNSEKTRTHICSETRKIIRC